MIKRNYLFVLLLAMGISVVSAFAVSLTAEEQLNDIALHWQSHVPSKFGESAYALCGAGFLFWGLMQTRAGVRYCMPVPHKLTRGAIIVDEADLEIPSVIGAKVELSIGAGLLAVGFLGLAKSYVLRKQRINNENRLIVELKRVLAEHPTLDKKKLTPAAKQLVVIVGEKCA